MSRAQDGRTLDRRDATRIAVATAVSAGSSYVVLLLVARTLDGADATRFLTFWGAVFAVFGVLGGLSLETTRAVTAAATRQAAAAPADSGRHHPRSGGASALGVGLALGAAAAAAAGVTASLWAPRLVPQDTAVLAALLSLGLAAYAGHSVVVGALAGRRAWSAYAGTITADALVRLVLVVTALVLWDGVVPAAAATVAASLTWVAVLWIVPAARTAAAARLDTPAGLFVRRSLAAAAAAGASALLVVGFAVLLSATTSPDEYAGAAPLIMAVTLTRAPLMVPLTAFQGVAVSHFVLRADDGLRALVPSLRVLGGVGLAAALAAWVAGPPLMALLTGYRVEGPLLAGLTLAATLLATLTLTGAMCQAMVRHSGYLGGWLVAVAVAVLVLAGPGGMAARTEAALLAGPAVGIAIHLAVLVAAGRGPGLRRPVPGGLRAPGGTEVQGPRVSVCMATYRGAGFVTAQLASVLPQLGPDDEVVVVDDASGDATVATVAALGDPRVRVLELERNVGYVAAFETALRSARGEYLLLCDQDDVWSHDHVEGLVEALATHLVAAGNLGTLDGPARLRGPYGQPDWRLRTHDSGRHRHNVLGVLAGNRPYYGCAMGVRREALALVLPFPALLTESHDLWIALCGNAAGSIEHLESRIVERRFHAGNASTPRPRGPGAVLASRLMLARAWFEARRRAAAWAGTRPSAQRRA